MKIIVYDFGSTSLKTYLFDLDSEIRLVASAAAGYSLYISDDGGVEQDTEEWWAALCSTTNEVLAGSDVRPEGVEGIAFCSSVRSSKLMAFLLSSTINSLSIYLLIRIGGPFHFGFFPFSGFAHIPRKGGFQNVTPLPTG